MLAQPPAAGLIGNRYELFEKLGAGGMGAVYRALDRLASDESERVIALKRLHSGSLAATEDTATFGGISDRLALAQEFRLLASLRHPNIISVLDYGFMPGDNTPTTPYFTMTLLENPRTLTEVAAAHDDTGKLRLVVQMLQALAYLHRRGIVHRDVKPGNILVDSDGAVRVVDFGLAVARGTDRDAPGGTLAYMSPEAVQGLPVTPASDLYAVGVMLYELFTGVHPFPLKNPTQLILDIMRIIPDMDAVPPHLRGIVSRLLEKDDADRYQDAGRLIADLCAAADMPLPEESRAIRESFLQSAQFVGREREISQLETAMQRIVKGGADPGGHTGSAWLVGGESGVGKTRLMEEIRIRALVQESGSGGIIVLRGGGEAGGGVPYQLWRRPMRRLALTTPLDDLQAGILKEIVPDIATLLGRSIPDVPEVSADLAQQRLVLTIAETLQRQTQPVLLLLDDLQWAEESLEPLKVLARIVPDMRLLIVASYRDDERSDLPQTLPEMHSIKLSRFDESNIQMLSHAMLGEAGDKPEVLDLLRRETEGNAFFLVEVVRALAEDAGSLDEVGRVTLPPSVFAEGIQSLVKHRLENVPAWAHDLLLLAAIDGRTLDLKILHALGDDRLREAGYTLDDWLAAGADAAVLSVEVTRWRFAHDKLREGLLAAYDADQRGDLHRQVAQAIERLYADDLPSHYNDLADHYAYTSDTDNARKYARFAAENAADRFAHREALMYVNRALQLVPPEAHGDRYALYRLRQRIYDTQGERVNQAADLETLRSLSEKTGDPSHRAEVALLYARYYEATGEYAQAAQHAQHAADGFHEAGTNDREAEARIQLASAHFHQATFDAARASIQQGLELANASGNRSVQSDGLHMYGTIVYHQDNDLTTAQEKFEGARAISAEVADMRREARAENSLGNVVSDKGDMATAQSHYESALALYQRMGDRSGEADVLSNLAIFAQQGGDSVTAVRHLTRARQIYRQINSRIKHAMAMTNLGTILYNLGEYDTAQRYIGDALGIRREFGDRRGEAIALINLGQLHYLIGGYTQALAYSQEAIEAGQALEIPLITHYGEHNRALSLSGLTDLDAAKIALENVIAAWDSMAQQELAMEARAALAQLHLQRREIDAADKLVEMIYKPLTAGELDGAESLLMIYQTCYEVFHANGDDRAMPILRQARDLLLERAGEIKDPEMRTKFTWNIRVHAAILQAWDRLTGDTDEEQ